MLYKILYENKSGEKVELTRQDHLDGEKYLLETEDEEGSITGLLLCKEDAEELFKNGLELLNSKKWWEL